MSLYPSSFIPLSASSPPFLPPRRIHHHRRLHLHLHRLRRLRCHDAGDGGARGEVSLGSERWGIESLVIWSLMYFVHLCSFSFYALEQLVHQDSNPLLCERVPEMASTHEPIEIPARRGGEGQRERVGGVQYVRQNARFALHPR